MSSFDFYDENDNALQKPNVVMRDSIGVLAVQMIASKWDLANIQPHQYRDMLRDLREIILNLQHEYQEARGEI